MQARSHQSQHLTILGEKDYYKYVGISEADHIYPTPPLGQDMTQGQFLSGV